MNEATSRGGEHDSPPTREQGSGFAVLDDEFGERFAASTEYASYALHDPLGQEIGKVEKVFVNGRGEPEYVSVKIGLFGRKTSLIPVEFVSVDGGRQVLILE
jgi:hypothetical protein